MAEVVPGRWWSRPLRMAIVWAAGLVTGGMATLLAFTLAGEFGPSEERLIDLGSAERFAPGSVTTFAEHKLHLVRLETGEFLALDMRDPHDKLLVQTGEFPRPCLVPWRPDFVLAGQKGWFRNPCHGETYDMAGYCVFGPCPRGLDRFPVTIEKGKVSVDVSTLVLGPERVPIRFSP